MQKRTRLKFGYEAHEALQKGVEKIAKAVTITMGPKGRNAALQTVHGAPIVVHDGVTVAERILLEDEAENQGALLVKEAARQTNRETGDGTTTVTLLIDKLVREGFKLVHSGRNPILIRNGMNAALQNLHQQLDMLASPIKKDQWKSIATISAQDEEIGEVISEAYEMAGQNGTIEVEKNASGDRLSLEHVTGYSFEKGFYSRHFVNDDDNNIASYEGCNILITDQKLSDSKDLNHVHKMHKQANDQNALVIICAGLSDAVAMGLISHHYKTGFKVLVVEAPEFGDRQKDVLQDISIFTGGQFVSIETGTKITDITAESFGQAEKIISDEYSTRIFAEPDEDILSSHIANIEKSISSIDNELQVDFRKKRIAKLTNGIVVINTGGFTDVENRELRERVKDAVGATKAAIESGVVPGGGAALLHASQMVDQPSKDETDDYRAGYELVLNICLAPLHQLVSNSGQDSGRIVEQIIQYKSDSKNYGYNAATGKVENLIKSRVLDPLKVVKTSLQNAVSTAGSIITTDCVITEVDDE